MTTAEETKTTLAEAKKRIRPTFPPNTFRVERGSTWRYESTRQIENDRGWGPKKKPVMTISLNHGCRFGENRPEPEACIVTSISLQSHESIKKRSVVIEPGKVRDFNWDRIATKVQAYWRECVEKLNEMEAIAAVQKERDAEWRAHRAAVTKLASKYRVDVSEGYRYRHRPIEENKARIVACALQQDDEDESRTQNGVEVTIVCDPERAEELLKAWRSIR